MTSRREFLEGIVLPAAGLAFVRPNGATGSKPVRQSAQIAPGFFNPNRPPDAVIAQTATGDLTLTTAGNGRWTNNRVVVTTAARRGAVGVSLSAPGVAIKRVHLRWRGQPDSVRAILGDAWERGYGDLEWRGWVADRVMPWYVATHDGTLTHCYGVRTGAKGFCFWQVDGQGISLITDVRSGGAGVELGDRTLDVCDVVSRPGRGGESAFAAIHAFCREMCPNPRLPAQPVYGSNDWYWVYGKNSADTILTDTRHVVELSPSVANRPFSVIDDGWQPGRGQSRTGVGTWDRGNEKFPDMPGLAATIRREGARPGIWIRPLQAPADAPDAWRLPRDRAILDPTVPEVRKKIADDLARVREWGYELIKHDYTTFDLFGRWGSTMGSALTRDGWTFASGPSRTTAEVIDELYSTIRAAAGDGLVIGCNTVSHLSAGHFDICRIGDDTSGTDWARTRKMGVNTLAFRGPQHGAFYVADADCVGVTKAVPWPLNRQWLDLLSRSGTMLFVSLAPDALGPEERKDLKDALARAATAQPLGEPLDWLRNVYPSRWRLMNRDVSYDWTGPNGAGG